MDDELRSSLKQIALSLSELELFGVQASDLIGDISRLDNRALVIEKLHNLDSALECLTAACKETSDNVKAALQAQLPLH